MKWISITLLLLAGLLAGCAPVTPTPAELLGTATPALAATTAPSPTSAALLHDGAFAYRSALSHAGGFSHRGAFRHSHGGAQPGPQSRRTTSGDPR